LGGHLYDIPTSDLRFFTVYGPMDRPDMAYFKFTDMFFNDEAIHIYNDGDFDNDLYRDFTYVDDIVEGILELTTIHLKKRKKMLPIRFSILEIINRSP